MVMALAPLAIGLAKRAGQSGVKRALAKKLGSRARTGARMGGRRRSRKGLTSKRKSDLLWLKNNIGKTAAANYLAKYGV